MTWARVLLGLLLLAAPISSAPRLIMAELAPATVKAFDQYVQKREAYLDQRSRGSVFLWTEESADRARRVRQGEAVIDPVSQDGSIEIKGGLVHDWVGAIFIPGVTLNQTLAFVQNYDNHKNVYRPEVIESKVKSHEGNDYRVFLRLVKKKVVTVVLNTEHEVHYYPVDAKRAYSRSYSRKIAEVDSPGESDEKEYTPGVDHGFLWRLYSYWHFQEKDGGVYVECEAISLTRGVPLGFGWMISPIVRDLPRESLASTLNLTRAALTRKP